MSRYYGGYYIPIVNVWVFSIIQNIVCSYTVYIIIKYKYFATIS